MSSSPPKSEDTRASIGRRRSSLSNFVKRLLPGSGSPSKDTSAAAAVPQTLPPARSNGGNNAARPRPTSPGARAPAAVRSAVTSPSSSSVRYGEAGQREGGRVRGGYAPVAPAPPAPVSPPPTSSPSTSASSRAGAAVVSTAVRRALSPSEAPGRSKSMGAIHSGSDDDVDDVTAASTEPAPAQASALPNPLDDYSMGGVLGKGNFGQVSLFSPRGRW